MIIVFSYDRPQMLARLLDEIPNCIVIDDGSTYDMEPFLDKCDYHRLEHGGKEGFWMNWQYALQICEQSDDDFFLFLQDDVHSVDMRMIRKIDSDIQGAYAFNYLNAGVNRGWTPIKEFEVDINGYTAMHTGYVDCGYFCNRRALEVLDFNQEWVHPDRFKMKGISSGVGQSQSRIFYKQGVPMYRPVKSLAVHGDHASKMHPEERKLNPLVSV